MSPESFSSALRAPGDRNDSRCGAFSGALLWSVGESNGMLTDRRVLGVGEVQAIMAHKPALIES